MLTIIYAIIINICLSHATADIVDRTLNTDTYLKNFIKRLKPNENIRTDIVFLLDESGSVTRNPVIYRNEKQFAEMLVRVFNITPESTRISLVTFANYGTVRMDYINKPKGDICNFLATMRNLRFKGGFSNIQDGMQIAGEVLKHSDAVRKYLIILSDGCRNLGDDPIHTAKFLKNSGIKIFGIAVALPNTKSCRDQLVRLLESDAYIYTLKKMNAVNILRTELKKVKSNQFLTLQKNVERCNSLCKSGKQCCDVNAQCGCDSGGDYKCVCSVGTTGSGFAGKCAKCPRGTYNSGTGRSKCQPCPPNSNTDDEGATSIKECKCNLGYMGNPSLNQACKFGKCPKLRAPPGGMLVPPNCGRHLNDSCSFWCKYPNCPYDGTKFNCLQNSRKLQSPVYCLANRKWSGPPMKCDEAKCRPPISLTNGQYECDSSTYLIGAKCFAKCDPRHKLDGDVFIECSENGTWIGFPVCVPGPVNCPPLQVPFKVKTHPNECSKMFQPVGTSCTIQCDNGYELHSETNVVNCKKDGHWNADVSKAVCNDRFRPEIDCPPSITIFNEPLKKTALVNWTLPSFTDNDIYPSTLTSVNSTIKSPYEFEIGDYKLVYTATDVNGLSSTCDLSISVLDNESPLVEFCPQDQEIFHPTFDSVQVNWEEPKFWDNSGNIALRFQTHTPGDLFKPDESVEVIYSASDPSKNVGTCKFSIKIKPYQCPFHHPPINGALHCKSSSSGQDCSVSCISGYVFSKQPDDVYTCINNNGHFEWFKDGHPTMELWPNCAGNTLPTSGVLFGSLKFEVSECVDISDEDQDAMVKEMENTLKTESPICKTTHSCKFKLDYPLCIPSPSTAQKRKREIKLTYNFDFVLDFSIGNFNAEITNDTVFPLSEKMLHTFYNAIGDHSSSHQIEDAKFNGVYDFACSKTDLTKDNSCYKCPVGTYFDTDLTTCEPCPFNTYQDTEGSTECKPCPDSSFTLELGSISTNQCKAPCQPGKYSDTGFEQCMACPIGSFQQSVEQTNCQKCADDRTTWSIGANSEELCTIPCQPGHYSSSGYEPCKPCKRGFYQTEERGIECIRCNDDLSTTDVGSSDVSQCLDINFCEPNPCYNGAKCSHNDGRITCTCLPGYFGSRCDITIDHCDYDSCLNGGTCVNNDVGYTCKCRQGFTGLYCEESKNECGIDACLNGGTCRSDGDSYRCECVDGFSGDNCQLNYDDCVPNACQNGGTCHDGLNTFHCCCPESYIGTYCEKKVNPCDSKPCANSGTCTYMANSYQCTCAPGFTGILCEERINYCLPHPCQNHGTCIKQELGFVCNCLPGFEGNNCETKLSVDFDIIFSSRSLSNYAMVNVPTDLNALSLSFWMRVEASTEYLGTPISYSYVHPIEKQIVANALTLYDVNKFSIFIHGVELQTTVSAASDNAWHHYVVTWDSFDGAWSFYKDGNQMIYGTGVAVNIPLWRGILVVGQDQNTFGGAFGEIEAFEGVLSQINLWNVAMSSEQVRQLHRSCGYIGNTIGWTEILRKTHGTDLITESPSSVCSTLGSCGKHLPECHCHNNNIYNSTLCENRLDFCDHYTCKNHQPCLTVNNVSICDCANGYTGNLCQYDINECLHLNGQCAQTCSNTPGSHICSCMNGYMLNSDDKTCKPLRQCSHKGLLYAHNEHWIDGCQKCRCSKGNVKCSRSKCKQISCPPDQIPTQSPGECCSSCKSSAAVCTIDNKLEELSSFDENILPYPGGCQYIVAKDCTTDKFSIQLQKGNFPLVDKKLIIQIGCTTTELTLDGTLTVNGELLKVPYESESINVNIIRKDNKLKKSNKPLKLIVTIPEDIFILWYHNGDLSIHIPRKMFGQMCGLCGDYNDILSDDFKLRDYTISETFTDFVFGWKVDSAQCPLPTYENPGLPFFEERVGLCAENEKKWNYAEKKCEPLRKPPFDKCYDVLNSLESYELCMQDACTCPSDLCHCDAIYAYILQCIKLNVTIGEWNGRSECENRCKNGMIFDMFGPTCPETCDKSSEIDPRCQIDTYRAGCHCPQDMILHENSCILKEDCP